MSNTKEIERRWLLKKMPYRQIYDNDIGLFNIVQHYVEENNDFIRYRRIKNLETNEEEYTRTIKTKIKDGVWGENEEPIDALTYEESIDKKNVKSINKNRFVVEKNGLTWELDDFIGTRLLILEVELEDIDQKIEIPDFLKECIIIEITGMDEFQNYSLAW